ncbi:MAG: hypothetical protein N4A76_11600 [Firmicutes bacterium]|nr:hypothetical protein [Bacillota bacterium]
MSIKIDLWMIIMLIALNGVIVFSIKDKISFILNQDYGKGYSGRGSRKYESFKEISEKRMKKTSFFEKEKEKVIRAGFDEEKGVAVYIFIKYFLSVLLGIIGAITNYPDISKGLLMFFIVFIVSELVVRSEIKRNNRSFQKNAYKIYKFLNNQVSSGIRISEALKNLYMIIDDYNMKKVLIRFSAIYIQTTNIDLALKEFDKYYNTQESESLCICIKQGITSGDSSNLLMRQEEMMFSKYVNYIQLETELQRHKGLICVTLLCVIVILMIGVPLMLDMNRALTQIFS